MESTLYLDLSTDATRKSIFGQLVAATPEQRRGNIGVVVGDDSIPCQGAPARSRRRRACHRHVGGQRLDQGGGKAVPHLSAGRGAGARLRHRGDAPQVGLRDRTRDLQRAIEQIGPGKVIA